MLEVCLCVITWKGRCIFKLSELNSKALQKASKGGKTSITLTAPSDFVEALNELSSELELKKSVLVRYLVYEKLASIHKTAVGE